MSIIIVALVALSFVFLTNTKSISGLFVASELEAKTPFQIALADPGMQEYSELHSNIGVMAFHGGAIEKGTEQIARCIADKTNSSFYIASGRKTSNNLSLHVTSTSILSTDSQKLSDFLFSVKTAISIHGHNRDDKIYVGGLNKELRLKVALQLAKAFPGRVVSDVSKMPNDLSATSEKNIVNAPIYKGVQIELPKSLRPYDSDYDSPANQYQYLDVCNAIANAIN
jgi:phage replication-related protein YjqB (UPF0714/DUF867 family)